MFLIPGEMAPFMHLTPETGAPVRVGMRAGCARSAFGGAYKELG